MDRGAWQAKVHPYGHKESDTSEQQTDPTYQFRKNKLEKPA